MDRAKERPARRVKSPRCTARRFVRVGLAPLLLWAATQAIPQLATGWAEGGPQAGQSAGPVIGAAAVGFEVKTLGGQPVLLERLRGRPLVMNFFASWCDPCREEMPLINALASRASKDGYAVLGIAIQDRRASVMEFAKEAGVVFPIALDLNSKVQRAYRVFGPPATFFIDAQGMLRDVVLGPITSERAHQALEKAGVSRSGLSGP